VTRLTRPTITRHFSKAWVQFLLLVFVIFVIPGFFGHPFAAGDNLIQFNPLRMLAAKIERSGNLPLWNQYIWSGTPLLAGFNAGAFLPTSWLYIILPPVLAWGLAQGLPYFLALFGFYLLMKEMGITEFTSRVTALLFGFAGVMIGQGVHLDMITGISLAPWMLLCASRIIEPGLHSRFRYAIYLAILYSMVVLAGAPEAMLDEVIMLVVYSFTRMIQLRAEWPRKLLWLCGAGILALGISAAQWVPGLEFQKISQRASPTFAFVSFGAFAPQYFYSFFAPYLFGGPGTLPISGFYGPFTWEEVTIYPTIGPIIALFVTIGRAIKRTLESKLLPYLLMAIVGTILALGSYTPVESLLYHVPLYGEQRLPGRNILMLDIAVFVFFAVWLDPILTNSRDEANRSRWLSFLPVAVIGILYVTYFVSPGFLTQFLHASPHAAKLPKLDVALVFAISCVTSISSGVVYFRAQGHNRKSRNVVLLSVIVLDLLVFNLFGGLGTPVNLSQFNSTSRQMAYVHSVIGNSSRFALYDPLLYAYGQMNAVGQPDLNIGAANRSIQGYGSLSLNSYESATQTHTQASLSPPLLASPLVDTLGTKVVLTSWHYLTTRYGSPTAVPLPYFYIPSALANNSPPPVAMYPNYHGTPLEPVATDTAGMFGRTMAVTGVDVNTGHTFTAGSIQAVGLLQPSGSVLWLSHVKPPSNKIVPGALHYQTPGQGRGGQIQAVGVIVRQYLPAGLPDPQKALVTGVGVASAQGYFALFGTLSSYLTYPHYRQIGMSGGISVFENSQSKPILQSKGQVTIVSHHTSVNGTLDLMVKASANASIQWAEAYAPGWKAKYISMSGKASMVLPTAQSGPLQQITVPQGQWKITVYYHPSSVYLGILVSIVAVAATILLLALSLLRTRLQKSQRTA
jgi:hypothetical protein